MNKWYYWLLVVIGFHLHAIDVPSHGGKRVVDTASILSATEVVDLESRLKNYERATSNQVVVLTVDSLQGETIETFAHEVFQSWKLGQKGVDNGVLILISVGEKNTARIEVGYGLEGVLPDITAGRIISQEMRPEFKQKHYHASILAGITAIQQAIGGTYVVPEDTEEAETETDPTFVFFWICIIVAAVITFFTGLVHPLLGGVIGVVAGFMLPWFILSSLGLAIILAIVGFIIGIVARALSESGGGGSGWSGSGGFSSGDSFSGGGGDSGGGGASGSLD
jgi:uncharacterized protein